jgi:glycosyltransferase involved in cell wall biosynthesis
LGVIGFQDGVDYLLRALYHLRCTLGKENFICTIAGDGDALPSLKQQALELGLSNYVLFPGWIESSHTASYIHSADICLAPEPSNLLNDRSTIVKIMDYMALAKPIVAFDLPEHRKTAEGAIFYATPNDELDFARKIAALMDDEGACRKMGQIGLERVQTKLSWAQQKIHLLAAYAKLSPAYLASRHSFSGN